MMERRRLTNLQVAPSSSAISHVEKNTSRNASEGPQESIVKNAEGLMREETCRKACGKWMWGYRGIKRKSGGRDEERLDIVL